MHLPIFPALSPSLSPSSCAPVYTQPHTHMPIVYCQCLGRGLAWEVGGKCRHGSLHQNGTPVKPVPAGVPFLRLELFFAALPRQIAISCVRVPSPPSRQAIEDDDDESWEKGLRHHSFSPHMQEAQTFLVTKETVPKMKICHEKIASSKMSLTAFGRRIRSFCNRTPPHRLLWLVTSLSPA